MSDSQQNCFFHYPSSASASIRRAGEQQLQSAESGFQDKRCLNKLPVGMAAGPPLELGKFLFNPSIISRMERPDAESDSNQLPNTKRLPHGQNLRPTSVLVRHILEKYYYFIHSHTTMRSVALQLAWSSLLNASSSFGCDFRLAFPFI